MSLFPSVSKVFERCTHDDLMNFFENNNIFCDNQAAFRKGTSTVTQLQELYNIICKNLDNKKTMKLLFLDITKAFDRRFNLQAAEGWSMW